MSIKPGTAADEQTGRLTLVTGGTGMIGGSIARLLLARGDRVRILARQRSDAVTRLVELGAELAIGDITDPDSITRAIEGCGDVYHCAALVDPFHWDLDDFERINVAGTKNVLNAAIASGAERFLHVSSIAAIGAEPGSRADETTLPGISWKPGYARSKFRSETLALGTAADMHVVSVNPAVVFGPGDRHFVRLIEAFLRGRIPAITFADRPMPLVYVGDVARGSVLALERGKPGHRYIIAQPTMTVREFFEALANVSGQRPPRVTLPNWLGVAGAVCWAPFVMAFRRRLPFSSLRSLRKGPADFDGGKASRELGLDYTPFPHAMKVTLEELAARD